MQKPSSNSVVIKSTPRKAIEKAVQALVSEWGRQHPEILRVIWFGSWINGIPGPGSDVDLCLILSRSELPMRERGVAYLPGGFPVGSDVFSYTESEFKHLETENPEWVACIRKGREILHTQSGNW